MTKHEDTATLSGVGSSDVLERAAAHLRTMAPHVRARLTAQLLKTVLQHVAELEAENKLLRRLAFCACGDGFTEDEPGMCVNCVMSSNVLLCRARHEYTRKHGALSRASARTRS